MKIIFEKIVFKNLQSYGDIPTTFYFTKSPTTLITGINGSGKSSILEAFVYALSGKSYRGSNKDELINTINQRDCLVQLYFSVDEKQYIINRGMKPNIFRIDVVGGKPIEESASIKDMQSYLENNILKTSVVGIIKTSVLGCNYKPFMLMSAKEKRDWADILLDINDFTEMSAILKKRISYFKDELSKYQHDLKVAEVEFNAKKELLEQSKKNKDETINRDKEELKLLAKKIKSLESEIVDRQSELEQIVFEQDINQISLSYDTLSKDLHLVEAEIKRIDTKIKKFEKLGAECTECGQTVSKEHTEKHINEYSIKLNENINQKEIIKTEITELNKIKESYNLYKKEKIKKEKEITDLNSALTNIKQIAVNKVRNHKELVVEEKPDIEKYELEYQTATDKYNELLSKESDFAKMKQVYLLATNLLKEDGIKANIVNQYIPILNQAINKYMRDMNSHITFNIDKNFEVRLDARYQGEFTYNSLSMGERQRIDLANTFGGRRVAALKNSVNTNVLFMDETFDASIDADGVDDLLGILDTFKDEGINVFVISHKGGLEDKLRSTVRLTKINGFSKIL